MTDDRAAEGLEHLQAAALELIAAARAFLDVAEDLVSDPDRVAGTVASLATLADLVGRTSRRRDPDPEHADRPASPGGRPGSPGRSRLRTIEVS